MRQYQFTRVTAIYGAHDHDTHRVTEGYAVRDTFDRGRHLGYVARDGRVWRAVRPKTFGTFAGFHSARHQLAGTFATRQEAAESLRLLARSHA